MVQRYPYGQSGAEDTCGHVAYTYDTNPINSSFSRNSFGRLTTAQYGCAVSTWLNGVLYGGQQYSAYSFLDMYSYHAAGGVTAKTLSYYGNYQDANGTETGTASVEADYTFDSSGRVSTLSNPANALQYQSGTDGIGNPIYSPCLLNFSYDSMGRPSGVTNGPGGTYPCSSYPWVQGVQYDYSGRMTTMQGLTVGQYGTFGYTTETFIQR